MLKDTEDFLKRLKELRKQIEKKTQEKTIDQLYNDAFKLLKAILGNKSQTKLIEEFEKEYVKKAKFAPQDLRILKNIVSARTEFKKGKSDSQKIDRARKDAEILINDLVEFSQRKDLINVEKGKMILKFKDGIAEILNCDGNSFFFKDNKVFKITDKVENTDMNEVSICMKNQKDNKEIHINPRIFMVIEKKFGKFEVLV